MKTLALDLSSKSSGWSVFEDGKYVTSGCLKNSSTDLIKRIKFMTTEIDKLLTQYNVDAVIMEEVLPNVGFNANTNTWKALMWLQASIVFLLYDKYPKVTKDFIYPNSWRKDIKIATGNNQKRETLKQKDIAHVKEKYGLDVNDDEADAIGINEAYYVRTESFDWT